MKKRVMMGAGATTLATAGMLGGMAIAGGGVDDRELERTVVAKPITATEAGPVVRGARTGKVIQTFYLAEPVVPPANGGTVVGAKCPRDKGDAIGGGAATDPGIILAYLSQLHPSDLSSPTTPRTYYVGVDDNSRDNPRASGARVEVQCAKGIEVRK